jgi:hypothetical protein
MRRNLILAVSALALLASPRLLCAQDPPQFAAKLTPAELKIETALAKRVKLNCTEVPIKDVLAELAMQIGLPIALDAEGFEESGVLIDQLVSVQIPSLSLEAGLKVLLGPLHLSYTIRGERITVTSEEQCSEGAFVRVYPVADLARVTIGGIAAFDFENLIDTLSYHIAPDSWVDNGGPCAIKAGPGGCLVVRQSLAVHRDIESLLAILRQLKSDQVKLKPGEVGRTLAVGRTPGLPEGLRKRVSLDPDLTLASFVEQIAKLAEIPMVLDPEGLEEAGVTLNSKVKVLQGEARVVDLLRVALEASHLRFVIEPDFLAITSQEKSGEQLRVQIYPVYDFVPPHSDADEVSERLSDLQDVITDGATDPDQWASTGGMCSISPWTNPPALVVSTTTGTHLEIEQLLSTLRASGTPETAAELSQANQRVVERVYLLYEARRKQTAKERDAEKPAEPIPSAEEVAKLIQELLPNASWKEKDVLLRPFHDRLIVRQRPPMLRRVEKYLENIDAWHRPPTPSKMPPGGFHDPF